MLCLTGRSLNLLWILCISPVPNTLIFDMKNINPNAVILIAFTTVVGAIFDATLIGAAVGLCLVLLASILAELVE